eukprot:GHVL01015262.1.p1 GENE.GHVL01015262.1~~GHVL01015262.1.p1  ORF type:complete len:410 (-),score=88.21 GHVL01015262.1:511-1740(-)
MKYEKYLNHQIEVAHISADFKLKTVACTDNIVITGGFGEDALVWKSSSPNNGHFIYKENKIYPFARFDIRSGVLSIVISPVTQRYVAVSSQTYEILIYDLDQQPQKERLRPTKLPKYPLCAKCTDTSVASVRDICWSPNEQMIASGGLNGRLAIWKFNTHLLHKSGGGEGTRPGGREGARPGGGSIEFSNEFLWLWKDETADPPQALIEWMEQATFALGQFKQYYLCPRLEKLQVEVAGSLPRKNAGIITAIAWDHDEEHIYLATNRGGVASVKIETNVSTVDRVTASSGGDKGASGAPRSTMQLTSLTCLPDEDKKITKWLIMGTSDGAVCICSPHNSQQKLLQFSGQIYLGSSITSICPVPPPVAKILKSQSFAVTSAAGLLTVLCVDENGKYGSILSTTPAGSLPP